MEIPINFAHLLPFISSLHGVSFKLGVCISFRTGWEGICVDWLKLSALGSAAASAGQYRQATVIRHLVRQAPNAASKTATNGSHVYRAVESFLTTYEPAWPSGKALGW